MHLAYKEKRRWLLSWAAIYFVMAFVMTLVTYIRGPDPHDAFGCSLPFSLWAGALFVASMTYYTSDYMRADVGQPDHDKPEQWVRACVNSEYCDNLMLFASAIDSNTDCVSLASPPKWAVMQVYDPTVGQYVLAQHNHQHHVK